MFVDRAKIKVAGGRGGDGCVSFRKEKFVNKGGPDGGSGGDGGSVIIRCDRNISSLHEFRYKSVFSAGRGSHGRGKNKDGGRGEDLVLGVPQGTEIRGEDGRLLADLMEHGMSYASVRGGRGGKGNTFFKSPVNRAPREAEKGGEGESAELLLELKLIADIGIVGSPNAGKSSLLRRISNAEPRVADYPFTTLEPGVGAVEREGFSFTAAEIPGLIKGAHEGKGLGDRFLRHVERNKLLLHLVDVSDDPAEDFRVVSEELAKRGLLPPEDRHIVAGNKTDLPGVEKKMEALRTAAKGRNLFFISCAAGEGIDELADFLAGLVKKIRNA